MNISIVTFVAVSGIIAVTVLTLYLIKSKKTDIFGKDYLSNDDFASRYHKMCTEIEDLDDFREANKELKSECAKHVKLMAARGGNKLAKLIYLKDYFTS